MLRKIGNVLLLITLAFMIIGCNDKIGQGDETDKDKETDTYTITFSVDEGLPDIKPVTVEKGKGMGDKYPKNPEKTGYDFVGWHDGKRIYTGATPVYNNVILSAKWNDAASPKNKFHVYLAFGQSNMVGYVGPPVGLFQTNNTNWVAEYGYDNPPENFVVMAAANNNRNAYNRKKGQWYPALPPLNVYNNGLSPADFFGRTMAQAVADKDIKIGVIIVAVDGCKSNLFFKNKENFISYITAQPDWMRYQCAAFADPLASGTIPDTDNYKTVDYPYKRLTDMAKIAQETGVIKGIIMAHDEGAADRAGNQAIREIYDDLCEDLGFLQGEIPLLAAQSVGNSNGYIASIPYAFYDIPDTVFIIPSDGCAWWSDADADQRDHFSFQGYEEMGRRFAGKMLELYAHRY